LEDAKSAIRINHLLITTEGAVAALLVPVLWGVAIGPDIETFDALLETLHKVRTSLQTMIQAQCLDLDARRSQNAALHHFHNAEKPPR
jgi:hypothetical protein